MLSEEQTVHIQRLSRELRDLSARFEREMRARGFDPAQAENTALPAALAELYPKHQETQAELAALLDQ